MKHPETSERGLSIVAGVVVALVVIGLWSGVGALFAQWRMAQVKRGWALKAVLVGARDVPAGAVLALGDVVVGEVPEQFFTGFAMFPQERSSLVGQTLGAPLARGELVNRGHLGHFSPQVELTCPETAWRTARSLGIARDVSVNAFLWRLEAGSRR